MTVTLFVNDAPHVARIRYFAASDVRFLVGWRKSCRGITHPASRDSLDLASIALNRWRNYAKKDNYARNWKDVRAYCDDNPRNEVANFVVLDGLNPASTIPWLNVILGVCHFRRTWCNNLFLDNLVAHPLVASRYSKENVARVGLSLLYYLAVAARALKSKRIWAETTQNSHPYYMANREKMQWRVDGGMVDWKARGFLQFAEREERWQR